MQSALECLPCMMAQAVRVARLAAPDDEQLQERVVRRFAAHVAESGISGSPPAMLRPLYSAVPELTGVRDPFAAVKKQANKQAAALLPQLRHKIRQSDDPLHTALNIAIIGNYMDAGTGIEFDWEGALQTENTADWGQSQYPAFRKALETAHNVLILGDNCGEIVLDTLLVEELQALGLEVTYAVRNVPVLNDATMEDAREYGMADLCTAVDSSADTPGAVPDRLSFAFRTRLLNADVVLAKGQGNFEGLRKELRPIWFAFKAKCAVVARMLEVPQGTSMFVMQQP
ncbi:damage-control phosphatase ARMT1 family protein [Oleidesulfovibrio sp.]|uniref:damage-control phosphatase ARMT1 family protein n=1 Tax=Oleidesulfovibrio sp. TaxID=2909707 RepID=UPI003A853273